ncbi:MAG: TonB-dependent receptor [Bacteroidota bacterium]
MRKLLLILCLILVGWGYSDVYAQGTTSSRMNGQVLNEAGEAVSGATILAVHTPTGSRYGAISNDDGYYRIPNMQVGGPYTVTTKFLGFGDNIQQGIFLTLGQAFRLDIDLSEQATVLDEVVITSTAGDLFDGNRTGSETYVSEEAINTIPTSSRRLNDFLRLTPQAAVGNDGAVNSGAISFAGVNNRFNAIFIDGAVNNDIFGLANTGTNGGQAGISPISPDALEQIQVVLAPYDVKLGGFAGGGINAVTRSGTNKLEGSAYYFLRNEDLAGKTPTDIDGANRTKLDPFTSQTYGFRVGGPIVKDKLFFFVNAELERREEPRPFVPENYAGATSPGDIVGVLDQIRQRFIDDYGYDPGGYLNSPQTTNGDKFLVKLDWNINDNNKLTVRHSYAKAETEIHPAPSNTTIPFEKTGYIFPSTTNSSAIELKSTIGNNMSNNLILGATIVRDDRDILGDPFPQVRIDDGIGTIIVGTDNFSYSNIVFQDVYTLTNNFTLSAGKHNFTFGTHNEFFQIQNLFTIFSTPRYEYFFNGLNRFLDGEDPDLVLFGHEQLTDGQTSIRFGDDAETLGPTFNALQMAFYAQDEWQVTEDFKLTLGLRADIPVFLEDPPVVNDEFNRSTVPAVEEFYDLQGARAALTPATQVLWSPRVGFNWDVNGEKKTQIRGGAGIFTSRVPWVWPGGQFIRNGKNSAFTVVAGVNQAPIYPTEQEWADNLFTSTTPTGDVDLFVEDFKYPQIFRASAAVDQKLPWGLQGTAEITFTKTINNIDVQNVNLRPSVQNQAGADNRPLFDYDNPIDPTYNDIILVDNTNDGYTFNFTAQLTKAFDNGFTGSIAYSYTDAEALFDGAGFINGTNWENVLSIQGNNNPSVARSIYSAGSRITSFMSYRAEYGNNFATTFSLFYTGRDGTPYTYVYDDPISDLSNNLDINDMIYVPASQGEINLVDIDGGPTAAQQWAALDEFISNDDYLSGRRGDYVEPNKIRTPFEHVLDLKIIQDFYVMQGGTKHNLQLTLDIFNFTNMLNKDWGRRYFVCGNRFPLIESTLNDGVAEFTFTDPGDTFSIVQSGTYSARWNAQFGVRYSF